MTSSTSSSLDSGGTPPSGGAVEVPLSAVHLPLPSFWAKNPRAWFCQREDQFHLRNNSAQRTCCYHVVAQLPPELADELDDLLVAPLADAPYDRLKVILHRTTDSKSSRLRQLLNAEELGDRRPTQMLHHTRQLLGFSSSDAHNDILREMFVERLPHHLRMILASASTLPLDVLVEMADTIAEQASPLVSSMAAPTQVSSPSTVTIASLHEKIQDLTTAVEALQLAHSRRGRSPRLSPALRFLSARRLLQRPRSVTPDPYAASTGDSICWYHRTFGAQARHCQDPCHWPENTQASR